MKILSKLLVLVLIFVHNINSRTVNIANIAKISLKEIQNLTAIPGVNSTLDTGLTAKFDNPTPIGTPGVSINSVAATGSHMQQYTNTIGYVLDINYQTLDYAGYLSKSNNLNSVVSLCLEFKDPRKNLKQSPATFKNISNRKTVFTFTNNIRNTFYSGYQNKKIPMLNVKLVLPEGRELDTVYILVNEEGAKIVSKPEMDKAIRELKCF